MRSELKKIRLALFKIAKDNAKASQKSKGRVVFDDDEDYQPVLIKGRKQASFSDNSALTKLIEEHEVRYRYAKDESERAAIRTTLESLKKALNSDK